jgi:hypothetical protein
MNLTEEDQKLLAKWLGECWHEWEKNNERCIKCNIHQHMLKANPLDFNDWRVVGELAEKLETEVGTLGAAEKIAAYAYTDLKEAIVNACLEQIRGNSMIKQYDNTGKPGCPTCSGVDAQSCVRCKGLTNIFQWFNTYSGWCHYDELTVSERNEIDSLLAYRKK